MVSAVAAAALAGAAPGAGVAADDPPAADDGRNPNSVDDDGNPESHIRVYAEAMGVTLERSRRRFELQDALGPFRVMLLEELGDSYVGAWINDEEDGYRVMVGALAADAERVASLLKGWPFADIAQVVEVDHSAKYLRDLAMKVHNASPVPIDSGVDVIANVVVIFVAGEENRRLLESHPVAGPLVARPEVTVETVDGLARLASHIQGGLLVGGQGACTSGFSVKHNRSGKLGVLTAGHCADSPVIDGSGAPLQQELSERRWDVQWHTVPGRHITNEVEYVENGVRKHQSITDTKHTTKLTKADVLCKSGMRTGYTCGNIAWTNICFGGIPNCEHTYVIVRGLDGVGMADVGDSGGPVFMGTHAIGTVSGVTGESGRGDLIYMPIDYISDLGLSVLTSEPPNPWVDDVAAFYDYGAGGRIHTWLSSRSSFRYRGDRGWWRASSGYSLERTAGRMVAGDFDGDGDHDTAAFYQYSPGARIHVWLSTGSALRYQGNNGWWRTTGSYHLSRIADRMTVGDFNADGKDDIAAFYDYKRGHARIHVWLSTGSSFAYQGDSGWWRTDGHRYWLSGVGDRMVAGDFDHDGTDDIAVFYDDGPGARLQVFLSNGTYAFTFQGYYGWWRSPRGYSLERVAGRMVAGDFDGDGDSDVATFYDYGRGRSRIHVWLSTDSSFAYQRDRGWWRAGAYRLSSVRDRVTVGDFNADGKDEIAAFYDYGRGRSRIHVWLSTGSSFAYQRDRGWWGASAYPLNPVGDRVVAGDFGK